MKAASIAAMNMPKVAYIVISALGYSSNIFSLSRSFISNDSK